MLATSDGARFLYGLERLGLIQGGVWAYELHDALGSVRQWTDASGAVVGMQSHGPYGDPLTGLGPALTAWGYTGEWRGGTGLVHLRARWYNPRLGVFTQVDRLGAATPAYAYASANPLRYTDPTGHMREDELRRASGRDPWLPIWKRKVQVYLLVEAERLRAAEDAYLSFLDDPRPFMEAYANPDESNREMLSNLDLFAEYSELDIPAGAGPLILCAAEVLWGPEGADLLYRARETSIYACPGRGGTHALSPVASLALTLPPWVRDAPTFCKWVEQALEKTQEILTPEDLQALVQKALEYGVTVAAKASDYAGHPKNGTPPHIHVGEGRFHLLIPPNWRLPWDRQNKP